MSITILISQHKDQRRALYLKNDQVIDVDLEFPSSKLPDFSFLDQIYWGRVVHVETSHAFVKLSENQVGLLPLEPPFPKPKEGQAILVQVRREAIPDKGTQHKGVLLTQKIIFAGRYCLLHPFQERRLLSSKIRDFASQNRLLSLIPAYEPITLRESATKASDNQISAEIAILRQKYAEIETLSGKAPCLTPYDAIPFSYRWLRDLDASENNKVLVDHDQALTDVLQFLKIHRPDLLPQVQKHKGSLFESYGLEDFWDSLFQDVVPLPSGGNIVLEVTAAAIIIDVNPGSKDARETNKEAIPTIIQQLKARHLGGNIIIDFIGLESATQDQAHLKDFLLKQASVYNLPLDIFGWSKLGWLEARLPKRRLQLMEKMKHRSRMTGI
jgi:ribonuclease G